MIKEFEPKLKCKKCKTEMRVVGWGEFDGHVALCKACRSKVFEFKGEVWLIGGPKK